MQSDSTKLRLFSVAPYLISASLTITAPVFAQQTAPATAPESNQTVQPTTKQAAPVEAADETADDIVVLSPFTVSAGDSEGWAATESLAGSRLKTNVKDLATPIQVLTMEFLDDFALNSIEDAAMYTVNVESRNELYTGNGLQDSPDGNIRIRGLSSPTNSREFFGSNLPTDNYNLERITIASGPNSVLFGLGSPAGVMDSTLRRARTDKSKGKLSLQVDSNGGNRGGIEWNQVLIQDKLAAMGAYLHDNKRWQEEHAEEFRERIYATMTWKPTRRTKFTAHIEDINIEGNRPSRLYPTDYVTPWYESSTLGVAQGGTGGGYPDQYVFPNNTAWQATRPLPTTQQLFNRAGNGLVVVQGDGGIPVMGWYNSVEIKPEKDWNHVPSINREADGYTLLNDDYYPTDINTLANIRSQDSDGRLVNFFVEQQLADGLFLEAGYQKADYDTFFWEKMNYIQGQSVYIDANQFLPDGITPNPNAGKTYFQGYPSYSRGKQKTEDARVTVSYEFDFAKKTEKLGFLGRHRIGGLLSANRNENRSQTYRYHLLPKTDSSGALRDPTFPGLNYTVRTLYPGINATPLISTKYQTNAAGQILFTGTTPRLRTGNVNWLIDTARRPSVRYYVEGDKLIPSVDLPIGRPWELVDANGEPWIMDPEDWARDPETGTRMVNSDGFSPSGKDKTDTKQISYQGFFLGNRLTFTYGYREDEVNFAFLDYKVDNLNGLQSHYYDVDFKPYSRPDKGTTSTYGVVLYPVRDWVKLPLGADIGFLYNKSDTFQPSTSNYTPFGELYPGSLGDGEDKGIILSLFENKLTARFTEYTNTAGPQRAGNVPFNRHRFDYNGSFGRIVAAAPSITADEAWPRNSEGTLDRVYNQLGGGDPYWVVSYREATGYEFSLDWSPTRNLNIRATWNEQDVVESQIGLDWWDFEATIEGIVEGTVVPEGGEGNPRDANGDGIISNVPLWDAPQTDGDWNSYVANGAQTYQTIRQRYEQVVVYGSNGRALIQALDGKSNEFVRENRANLNANYRFTEGKFRGWDAGTGLRWRAAPLIGYETTRVGANDVVDLTKPLYGDEEFFVDLRVGYRGKLAFMGDRNFRANLNVRNVTDSKDGVLVLVNARAEPIRLGRPVGREVVFTFDLEF